MSFKQMWINADCENNRIFTLDCDGVSFGIFNSFNPAPIINQSVFLFNRGDNVPLWMWNFNPKAVASIKFGVNVEVVVDKGFNVYPQQPLNGSDGVIIVTPQENPCGDAFPFTKDNPLRIFHAPRNKNFINNRSLTDLMLDSDLHTQGHDIHFRDCLDCGKSFRFRDEDQFQCASCELRELEDHRRERIEDALLGANRVLK